jgi:nuclear transport factor 2 (NTF2) superfamily protein
LRK